MLTRADHGGATFLSPEATITNSCSYSKSTSPSNQNPIATPLRRAGKRSVQHLPSPASPPPLPSRLLPTRRPSPHASPNHLLRLILPIYQPPRPTTHGTPDTSNSLLADKMASASPTASASEPAAAIAPAPAPEGDPPATVLPPGEGGPEIAFFDVETSVPQRAGQGYALLEFGAILVCPRRLVEVASYATLVRPADPVSAVSAASVRCNGITRDAVSGAPPFRDVADAVYDLLNGELLFPPHRDSLPCSVPSYTFSCLQLFMDRLLN